MTQPGITIRSMAPDDAPKASEILSAGYGFLAAKQGFSPSQLQDLLTGRCTRGSVLEWLARWDCFVAVIGDIEVGIMALGGNCLEELWIRPDCHGRGIGSALFGRAEREMAKAGESTLTVRTTGFATGFYEKMGAVPVGTRVCPSGPLAGWTLTSLEKPLAPAVEFEVG